MCCVQIFWCDFLLFYLFGLLPIICACFTSIMNIFYYYEIKRYIDKMFFMIFYYHHY